MTTKPMFAETEQAIGYVTISSGSILITDGIWDSKSIHSQDKHVIDLNEEKTLRVPVLTVIQNERRFILLDIDAAVEIPLEENPVEMEETSEHDLP